MTESPLIHLLIPETLFPYPLSLDGRGDMDKSKN